MVKPEYLRDVMPKEAMVVMRFIDPIVKVDCCYVCNADCSPVHPDDVLHCCPLCQLVAHPGCIADICDFTGLPEYSNSLLETCVDEATHNKTLENTFVDPELFERRVNQSKSVGGGAGGGTPAVTRAP